VELQVVDHGPGIPPGDRDRLFQPFQRLGDASGGGVGLGLAVAHGFLDAMHGQIIPGDTPGGGLTMRISLPIADGQPEQGAAP
jgi:two-component system sensor histidine kinase KdpD